MFDVPETAFHVNVAQQFGLADPPTDPFSFGLPFFNVTNYSLVTDSPTAAPGAARQPVARGRHSLPAARAGTP